MKPNQNPLQQPTRQVHTPALEILAQISQMEQDWIENENDHTTQHLLNDGIPLFDRVTEYFQHANETTMVLWTSLQKASLMVDLANSFDGQTRTQLARHAFEGVQDCYNRLAAWAPSDINATTGLYLQILETLMKLRALVDDPDQLETLDVLIQGLSAQFGELLALDQSLRSQANDQLFTAHVIASFLAIEEDAQSRQALLDSSQNLAIQAYDLLSITAGADMAPAAELLQTLTTLREQENRPASINCPQCGADSQLGTPFCSQCGTRLNEEAT